MVNRQIYQEAKDILYSRNTFAFSEPQHMLNFLNQMAMIARTASSQCSFPLITLIDSHMLTRIMRLEPSLTTGQTLRNCMFKENSSIIPGWLPWSQPWTLPLKGFRRVIQAMGLPGMKLTGYDRSACKYFPQKREITTKQWDEPDEQESATNGNAEEGQGPDVEGELP